MDLLRLSALRQTPGFSALVLTLALISCVPVAVEWDGEVRRIDGPLADTLELVWEEKDEGPQFMARWEPAVWPSEPDMCSGSVRASLAPNNEAYASWFAIKPDSSVVLRVARSDDGGTVWNPGVDADTTDIGREGCNRPPPYIYADAFNGYVHIVYHLVAIEGAGLFFTHTMERGELFHMPVPIVYGKRPAATSVVSRGDTVLVAYEDPNSRYPRLGLAVSRTQGHIFEHRLPASDETGEARTPRVAFIGDRVAVAWTATQRGGGVPRTVIRFGTLVF